MSKICAQGWPLLRAGGEEGVGTGAGACRLEVRQVCSMASAWGNKVRSLVERWHGEGLGSLTGRFLGV